MLDKLHAFLCASDLAAPVTMADRHITVALSTGVVQIFYEPRGHEFYGEWLGPSGQRVELIELAQRCGIRTQFMSHDEESARAVFEQVLTVLHRLVAQPQILEQ